MKEEYDEIKALTNGLSHVKVHGSHKERIKIYNQKYKKYVEQGLFIRDVQVSSDARKRIDYYYSKLK